MSRTRWSRPFAIVAGALTACVLAAGCHSSPKHSATPPTTTVATTVATVTASTLAVPTTVAPSSAPPAANGGKVPATIKGPGSMTVGNADVPVPVGWVASNDQFGHSCIEPLHTTLDGLECDGLDVYYGWDAYLPGNEQTVFTRKYPGWYHSTGTEPCPVGYANGSDNWQTNNGPQPREQLSRVGDRTAYYWRWTAGCQKSSYTFHPEAWLLPVSKVLIFDYAGSASIDKLVPQITFTPGGWVMGSITHTDPNAGTVAVKTFDWLSGPAAQAYARKHNHSSEVPNDYLVVNVAKHATTHPLAPGATFIGTFELGTHKNGPDAGVYVSRQTFLHFMLTAHDASAVDWHLHLDANGAIDQVIEQYHP